MLAESPPPGLPPKLAQSSCRRRVRFAGASGNSGAFTVSFLADPARASTASWAPCPACPRPWRSSSPSTSWTCSALEPHLSRGGTLDGELPEPRGHALQVCLSALDPEDGLRAPPRRRGGPAPPRRCRACAPIPPSRKGSVPAHRARRSPASPPTAAPGPRRSPGSSAASPRTEAALRGGATDKAFLTEVLDRPELTAGGRRGPGLARPRWWPRGEHLPAAAPRRRCWRAAIAGYEAELDVARARFYASAARGRPEVPEEIGRAVELRHRGHAYLFRVSRLDPGLFRLEVDGRRLEVRAEPPGPHRPRPRLRRAELAGLPRLQGSRQLVEVDGIPHRIERTTGEVVRSPSAGAWSSRSPSRRGTRWRPAIPLACSKP